MQKTKLIVIAGLPGAGKSTVAEGLAAKLATPHEHNLQKALEYIQLY